MRLSHGLSFCLGPEINDGIVLSEADYTAQLRTDIDYIYNIIQDIRHNYPPPAANHLYGTQTVYINIRVWVGERGTHTHTHTQNHKKNLRDFQLCSVVRELAKLSSVSDQCEINLSVVDSECFGSHLKPRLSRHHTHHPGRRRRWRWRRWLSARPGQRASAGRRSR